MKIERVNKETFFHIYNFIAQSSNEFISKEYEKWLLEITPTRQTAVDWWNNLPENHTKENLMERHWDKFRPYIQMPHFILINSKKISGREIEIIYNEEHK